MITMTHTEVMNSEVRLAYGKQQGRAGRVVSGMLKAAVNSGKLSVDHSHGRVTGTHVCYSGPQEVFDEIRKSAIARAAE